MEQSQHIEAVYHPDVDPLIVGAITGNRLLRCTVQIFTSGMPLAWLKLCNFYKDLETMVMPR